MSTINKLKEYEAELRNLLNDSKNWNSLFVDYHKPYVERLWRQVGDYRINLHRIFPCNKEEALFHPHPWPSSMKIIDGIYEMGYGYSENPDNTPDITSSFLLTNNCYYEMLSPADWHYVRPLDRASYSIMLTGKPFKENQGPTRPELQPLPEEKKQEILDFFKGIYR